MNLLVSQTRSWTEKEVGTANTLSTGSNQGIVGDHIWFAALAVHLIEQLKGQLPLASLLTGADEAGVGDDIALAAASNHVLAASAQLQSGIYHKLLLDKNVSLMSHDSHYTMLPHHEPSQSFSQQQASSPAVDEEVICSQQHMRQNAASGLDLQSKGVTQAHMRTAAAGQAGASSGLCDDSACMQTLCKGL